MTELPRGTVTFLFTDVEGSTRLLSELGPTGYAKALARHRQVLRASFSAHGGVEVDTQGDAFFVAFPSAIGALDAAAAAQSALEGGPVRVRMGIHTGEPVVIGDGYVGLDVHRAARIAAAGHGGQVLVSQATEALVRDPALVDLGYHRLKDLTAAERIYQLGNGTFAPLKTLYRTNLPVTATPFVGREDDLDALADLLGRIDVRLVTVTGPGGVGKTRLALQAAAAAAERYPDGVTWVPLAPVRDPALVVPAIEAALQVDAGRVGTRPEGLARAIDGKDALILLDNVEHVIGAAARIAEVVSGTSSVTVLATSRAPLLVAAEHEYPLAPLRPADAVQLFVERARAVRPEFESSTAVETLCERLDGLPLALELAAAHTRGLSPEALVERVDIRLDLLPGGRDADPRQRTLRATIEWSYDLLDVGGRDLFARLAVFVGGCRLDDAVAVCRADVLALSMLVENSLVRRRVDPDGGDRYWMLETIREFAVERLGDLPDATELRRRHTYRFLATAEAEQARLLAGEPSQPGYERIAADEGNLRLSLETLHAIGDADAFGRLCASLFFHWYFRGDPREGDAWTRAALSLDVGEGLRSELENELAGLLLLQGGVDEAYKVVEAAVARARLVNDDRRLVFALTTLGNLHLAPGDLRDLNAARDEYEEALALCAAQGGGWYERGLLSNLAHLDLEAHHFEDARRRFDLARSLSVAADDRGSTAANTIGLAWVAAYRGELAAARAIAVLGISAAHEIGMRNDLLWCLHLVAYLEALDGDAARGAILLAATLAAGEREGVAIEQVEEPRLSTTRAALRNRLGEAELVAAAREGAELALDAAVRIALEALS